MLALLTPNLPAQADEPIDRDPGIITLTATLLRALNRQTDAAFRRRCNLAGRTNPLR
ncbi:hypothetical protein PMNALOAF_2017 [Methylobacterium adhaesivum]|jgi:hypothetical protein|uniref:Uncharacterized protein n=1 Tax=Methylobacterium adhaesivum TaxID=333297 RepID=A0ABT8BG99_9HYPH|nr:hypothetical protein [Methylobacterium adhaesivum]MDN3590301.1 hypothetical protein [Methylobacterium adhaesivum]GJD30767.1 hypothetical protein PMNALOAF_2017 [Methylobacterium adhaesivum]